MSAFDQDFIDLVHASVVDREAAMFLIGIAVGYSAQGAEFPNRIREVLNTAIQVSHLEKRFDRSELKEMVQVASAFGCDLP